MPKVTTPELPIASGDNQIESYMTWLKAELEKVHYGEVGLTFFVHQDQIVRVNQTKSVSCKAGAK